MMALITSIGSGQQVSPYAGQQTRDIKALSEQEIDDLLNARGMALAKAAELNGYPGPLHTIELAADLGLTPDQLRLVSEIRARMERAAIPVGTEIVAVERELDQLFHNGMIVKSRLDAIMARLGTLQGQLRGIHLSAHLETKALLRADQIARYNEVRGYTSTPETPAHDPARRHGG
jgi:hypothetical protein